MSKPQMVRKDWADREIERLTAERDEALEMAAAAADDTKDYMDMTQRLKQAEQTGSSRWPRQEPGGGAPMSDEGRARALRERLGQQPSTAPLVERLRARYENALPAGGETTWIRLADFGALLAALTAAEQERDEAVREFHAAINEPAYAGTRADWIARCQDAEARVAKLETERDEAQKALASGRNSELVAGREGGESQPLPPNPTCPECHGTGDAPNAQFRCPCRWRHLSKAGREGER
jgi:hypothetical protein